LDTVTVNVPKGVYWEEFQVSSGAGATLIRRSWQRQMEVVEPVIA